MKQNKLKLKIKFQNLPFEDKIAVQRKYGLDLVTINRMIEFGFAPLNFDADSKVIALAIGRKLLKIAFHRKWRIMFRKSSSRRGFHFTVFKNDKQLFLPFKEVLKIREKIGDCYGRLDMDRLRAKKGYKISILFNKKNYKQASEWEELYYLNELK
jgi:hypothetical protein